MDNRRSHPRTSHYFDCRWFSQWGVTDVRLDDLSVGGCHVMSRHTTPAVGEIVNIEVIRATKEPLGLSGEVVQIERGIGFAVRFGEIEAKVREQIEELLSEAQLSNERARPS